MNKLQVSLFWWVSFLFFPPPPYFNDVKHNELLNGKGYGTCICKLGFGESLDCTVIQYVYTRNNADMNQATVIQGEKRKSIVGLTLIGICNSL